MARCRSLLPALLFLAAFSTLGAQQPAPHRTLIRAGRLIDGLTDQPRTDQGVLVAGERIMEVGPYASLAAKAGGAERIDLSGMTVLPGLIDAHTHILLNGDITAQDYDEQLLKQSIPYRAILATPNVRTSLLNDITAQDYDEQLLKQSIPYRAI